jgi:hypothetical protein
MTGAGHEGKVSLLHLLDAYRQLAPDDSGGFARPAPPESPPLPLRFTCAACGAQVNPDASRCGGCDAQLYRAT